jgi:pyruvate dehydrogenase E2 component (dihydrolipoamide acetyltransferase)
MDEAISRVVMPKWGLSMTTGKITTWLVDEGAEIGDGDELAEVETDKIAGSLESNQQGLLRKIVAGAGADVPVGATVALVAPAEVPDQEVERAAEQAREELAAGEVAEVAGPETGSVEVDGRRIAWASLGEADEAVVLVHGYGGDKNSWLFVQEPLSERASVHAIDLPGHGESTKDVGDGSLSTLAGSVLGFLREKGIDRAHLVGHSLGGAVVVEAAAQEPARVASLTLLAPAGLGSAVNADYLRGFAAAGSRRELRPHLKALFADPDQATRQLADDLMKFKRIDGVDAALNTLVGTLLDGDAQRLDVSGALSRVEVPVAVVWGRQDGVLPVDNAAAVGDRSVSYVDDAGHMVHMEKPTPVVEAVRGQLK